MRQHPTWRLDETTADAAGNLLVRAFIDEPIFVAALPDRTERMRLCPPLFSTNIRYACRFGEAWAAGVESGKMLAVLYWVAMPDAELTPELAAELGLDAISAEWDGALERVAALEEQGIAAIPGLHSRWRYLQMIGVEPAWQGRGLGSVLLHRAVDAAAESGVPLCLVTDRPRNVPLYLRAGFELAAEGVAGDEAVPWWAFRTPAP